MIEIEDRFADVVITDEDVDQIEVVGDLIRHIENVDNVDNERRRRSIVEAPLQRSTSYGLSSRAAEPAEQQDLCEQ